METSFSKIKNGTSHYIQTAYRPYKTHSLFHVQGYLLYGIDQVYVYIFRYNFISLRKDRMSSMLTLSKRSFILFALKKRFLMREKAPHSMRKCLTVHGVWHVAHCGCCSCLSIKECVNLVWPMRNQNIITCSGGARSIMVSRRKWTHRRQRLLGKVWIHQFSLQLWINSRADWAL